MDLRNLSFQLVNNQHGLAASATVMTFGDAHNPQQATYRGANIASGHVLLQADRMLYHAMDTSGDLSAGEAKVDYNPALSPPVMTLQWQWLTGNQASGISVWHQILPANQPVTTDLPASGGQKDT